MPASGGPRSSFVVSAARVSARSTGFSHRVGVSSVYLAPAHLALPHPDGLLTNE